MKHRKITATILTLALSVSVLGQIPSHAATDIATDVYTQSTFSNSHSLLLSNNLKYTENTITASSNSYNQNYIFEYTPGAGVMPVVAYGGTIYGKGDITEAAAKVQSDGKTILCGINSDYFSMSSGVPEGLTVTDGVVRSSDSYQNAVGINADGSMFIGKPQLKMILTSQSGYEVPITYINKVRTNKGIYLLNKDYNNETGFSRSGINILLRKTDNADIKIGGTVTMSVERIENTSSSAAIADGYMVLSVSADGPTDKVSQVKVGDTLTLSVTSADTRWNSVRYACGGGDILIENGIEAQGLKNDLKPRTALGIRSNGTVLLYAVDGSQPGYSAGISPADVAHELLTLGCVSAINLDGGGSTTVGVSYPGNTSVDIANSPSDGKARECSTFIFLTNTAQRTGSPSKLYIYPYNSVVMSGAAVNYESKAVDNGYYPSALQAPASYSAASGIGTFNGSVFTAGSTPGEAQIFASCGGLSANAKVRVINDTSKITVSRSDRTSSVGSISAAPNEAIDLNAKAYFLNQAAYGSDELFTWSVDENIGTINAQGIFTAGSIKGLTGNINVTYGTKTLTIPVAVGRSPVTVEPFDTIDNWIFENASYALKLTSDYSNVKYGTGAMSVNYDFSKAPESDEGEKSIEISVSKNLPLAHYPDYLNVWVYSDGSGNLISLNVQNSNGQTTSERKALDVKGWQLLSFELPSSATKIRSIVLTSTGSQNSGTLIFDQLIASYGDPIRTSAQLNVTINSADTQNISAVVSDSSGNAVKASDITLYIDGKKTQFSYDMSTGALTASYSLSTDLSEHRVTLIARDTGGNLMRQSKDIAGTQIATKFSDMTSHWACKYVDFLSAGGVLSGESKNGALYFNPDRNTTRTEMAVIISRYLGLDTSKYENAVLPFADLDKIPEWAMPHVKAMYSKGLMSGSTSGGKIYFKPNSNISRMEAITILGRTLPQGYKTSAMTYKDCNKISAWAIPHFEKLAALGIIGGYSDNTIRPNANITRGEVSAILYRLY